jgi:hypothetical protein
MKRKNIPVYELSEYRFAEVRTEGVFVEKLEDIGSERRKAKA